MSKIVDLSHHQGNIDWAAASKEIDLAIIRVQYGSATIDTRYKEYVAACKKYNIPFGHYAYARFVSVADAKKEARDFLFRADKQAKFLVVDVEELTTSKDEIVEATQAFIDECKKVGWKVGLYTGHHFYKPYRMDKVKADFVWIPRYGDKKPDYPHDIWQYTDCGKLAGVGGNVDLNKLSGSKPLSYFIGEPKPKPKAEKPKVTAPKGNQFIYPVKAGDTLTEIAKKHNMSVTELAELNEIHNINRIYVGQRLKLKGGAKRTPQPKTVEPVFYKVKLGDTLGEIADQFKTTTKAIDKLNKGITNVNRIYTGQKIRVK